MAIKHIIVLFVETPNKTIIYFVQFDELIFALSSVLENVLHCSGASSIAARAARKYLTNYLRMKFSYTLQEIFVISSTGMAYHLYLLFTKAIGKSRLSCAKIEAYHIVQHQ
jgi:hypothetical protein